MDTQLLGSSSQSNPYLSPNQQDLLLAALRSQAPPRASDKEETSNNNLKSETEVDMSRLDSFSAAADGADTDAFGEDYTPDLDYLDGDTSYDFDNADLGGDLIGALPGSHENHEKRKNPDEDDGEEGDAKRQETQEGEKGAKKPGRKPLTSEPTTKRKAQNRAAQRAFRERKEKHLKDLETKVSELTKASEAEKHENGLLKAQVERLQTELKEYRKRLAMNGNAAGRSPPLSATTARSNSATRNSVFSFDFPKFGALPGSQIFGNSAAMQSSPEVSTHRNSTTPSLTHSPSSLGAATAQASPLEQSSANQSLSPQSLHRNDSSGSTALNHTSNQSYSAFSTDKNMHGFAETLGTGVADPLTDLFSPSILKSAGMESYFSSPDAQSVPANGTTQALYNTDNGGDNSAGLSRVFQFNAGSSVSDTTSPSASTPSQWNGNVATNSSCGTSPEPAHDSPAIKDTNRNSVDKGSQFAQYATGLQPSLADPSNPAFSFGATDYSMPSMASFDPVLFGDYRESQDAIVGDGEFNNGFFDDSLNTAPFDYASPSNLFGILSTPQPSNSLLNSAPSPQPPSKGLMAAMDKTRDGGDDEDLVNGSCGKLKGKPESTANMISCNNIWSQLQSNPDFQEGKFDLDHLCQELRQKARCSESGVMVEQSHVDAALRKLGKKDDQGNPVKPPHLMFEQQSWDRVIAKLGNNRQS